MTFALLFWAGAGIAEELQAVDVAAASQEKVTQLLQTVIQDWNGGGATGDSATNGGATQSTVEAAFRAASKLMPERLDLRFGIASSLVSQALQTNGPQLELKVGEALRVYEEIQAMDTNGFEAPMLYAAYARAIGKTNASQDAIRGLMTIHPQRTGAYVHKLGVADGLLKLTPHEQPSRAMPNDAHHAIVVLGAGLETNGTMKPKLASRLGQCLRLAKLYPNAPILLTGGNQKNGVTEAYAMSQWCTRQGISRKRLVLEDKAKDTVENALFSAAILQRLGATHVTLVTSSSHVRRGLADFEEACRQRGLNIQLEHLAASTKGDTALDQEQERLGVYRDLMRTSGLWAFPGIQR